MATNTIQPFWDTPGVVLEGAKDALNVGYDSRTADMARRSDIMNDELSARDEREAKARDDYYAAKKQAEVQNSMFGGTQLANTPNHNTDSGVKTSAAKALATFGVALLTGGLAGIPVGVAAAAGLNQAGKQYGRDMNRSFRLNQALDGRLDQYTDISKEEYILNGNLDSLKFMEEENSQIRKFQERQDREQFIGSGAVFEQITGKKATAENGFQGAGMYSKDWNEFSGQYDDWKVKADPRLAEAALNRTSGSSRDVKAFAGGATSFQDANGNRTTLYRMDDGSFRDSANRPVNPVELGLTEVNQDNIDIAKKVMSDSTSTPSQRDWAAGVLQADALKESERGLMSPSRYETYVDDVFDTQATITGLSNAMDVLQALEEDNVSRLGQGTINSVNRYLEPLGFSLGDAETRQRYQASEADRLELVAQIIRAFAPVSDTAMELVMQGFEGKTFEQTVQSADATRRRFANQYNTLLEQGKAMQVGGTVSELQPISTTPLFVPINEEERSDDELLNLY
ncbi:hypothetical protein AB4342_01380 [Vibrio breoganii]